VALLDAVPLPAGGQTTIVIPNTYPDLANKAGTVEIEADINRLTVTGIRSNYDTGALSALPTVILNSAATPAAAIAPSDAIMDPANVARNVAGRLRRP